MASARDARADTAATILQVRSTSGALDQRIRAELSTLGFEVSTIDAVDARVDLGAIARARGASAAVRVDRDSAREAIELWVDARPDGQAEVHEMIRVDRRRGEQVATTLALEALRAHLLAARAPESRSAAVQAPAPPQKEVPPVEPSPPVERAPSAPAPEPSTAVPAQPHRLWIHFAAGGQASPGGVSPSLDLFAEVRFAPRPPLAIALVGATSLTAPHLETSEGAARVRHAAFGVVLDFEWRVDHVAFSMGAGGAAASVLVHGEAAASGFVAQDAATFGVGPLARTGAAIEVTSWLRVRGAVLGAFVFPEASISFAGARVATWGRPFVLFTVGIEYGAF